MANWKRKGTGKAKGCGCCTPWKRVGNSAARRTAKELAVRKAMAAQIGAVK